MATRERILAAASELIYQKGYLATAISDIMQAADVGKGQLYHHFTSKQDLGLAVLEQRLAQWRKDLFEDIFHQPTPESCLEGMVNWFFQFHQEQEVFYGCPVGNLIVELSTQEPAFRERLEAFIGEWVAELARVLAKKSPELTPTEREDCALAIISSLQGGAVLVKLQQDIHALEVIKDQVLTDLLA